MTVKLYTLPSCGQCIATKSDLKRSGIPFEVVDMATDSDAADLVKSLGYQAAPVVVVSGDREDHWSGYQPVKIKSLAA